MNIIYSIIILGQNLASGPKLWCLCICFVQSMYDLVPCVPILFKDEQIILWKGKNGEEHDSQH